MGSERILAAAKRCAWQGPFEAPEQGQQVFWRLGIPILFLGLPLKLQTHEGVGWSGVGRRGPTGGGGVEWVGHPEMAGGRPGRS